MSIITQSNSIICFHPGIAQHKLSNFLFDFPIKFHLNEGLMMLMLKLDSKYVVCGILEKLAGTGLYIEVHNQTNYWQLFAFEVN